MIFENQPQEWISKSNTKHQLFAWNTENGAPNTKNYVLNTKIQFSNLMLVFLNTKILTQKKPFKHQIDMHQNVLGFQKPFCKLFMELTPGVVT